MLLESSICRYDGYEFINYPIHFGLESDFVSDFKFDYAGRICISTIGEGIACLEGNQLHWMNKAHGLPSNKITGFEFTNDGALVCATEDAGIVEVSINREKRTLYPSDISDVNRIRKLLRLRNGDIISTGKQGLFKLIKAKDYKVEWLMPEMTTINSCFETNDGEVWIGGDRQLVLIKKNKLIDKTEILKTLDGEPTNVWHISQSKDSTTLYLSTSKGLLTLTEDRVKWLTTGNGLPFNDICGTRQDRFGNFWVATYAGGVAILDNEGLDHFDFSAEHLPLFPVSFVNDEDGRLWMGSNYNESLFYFENEGVNHFPDNRLDGDKNLLHTMALNPVTKEIWVGGNYGRIIKIKDRKIISLKDVFDNDKLTIENISFLKDGTGIICTHQGVFKMPVEGYDVKLMTEIPAIHIRSSFSDAIGNVWFLGKKGEIFQWKDGNVKDFSLILNPKKYGLEQGMFDELHQLWWFCSAGGLIGWNGIDKYVLNSSNILQTDYPWSIVKDKKDRIWIGHKKGIECLDLEKKKVHFLGYNQGFTPLETNRNASTMDVNGDIWFGTLSSASRVRTTDINADDRTGSLRLQKIIAGKEIIYKEAQSDTTCPNLELAYNQNTLIMQMAGLFYSNTKNVSYSWYMENYDSKWNLDNKNREALYIDLPPGNYIFHAKAVGPNGAETNEIIFKIFIRKPLWQRPWFYIIEFSILAVFVFFSFRFSSDPNKNKLGNFMTLLTILIVFESLLIWLGTYVNKFTNDIAVFQLVMNVLFAATLHPLENLIRKFMRRWSIRKVKSKRNIKPEANDLNE